MVQMSAPVSLEIVPGASHLFEEPGTLEEVARLARHWFERHLARAEAAPATGGSERPRTA
jgi:putative phosphoribosyl transferase